MCLFYGALVWDHKKAYCLQHSVYSLCGHDVESLTFQQEKLTTEFLQRKEKQFSVQLLCAPLLGGEKLAKSILRNFEEIGNLDIIVAPVGGGGLLSGTALAAKFFSPATQVIGAEPAGADDAFRSMQSGKIEPVAPNSVADGLLTTLGDKTFRIIQNDVKEIITATDKEIIGAMRLVWERLKIVIEPSAAVPLAVVLKTREKFIGRRVGIIISGGNVDLEKACSLFSNQS